MYLENYVSFLVLFIIQCFIYLDDWLKIITDATGIETTPPKPKRKKSGNNSHQVFKFNMLLYMSYFHLPYTYILDSYVRRWTLISDMFYNWDQIHYQMRTKHAKIHILYEFSYWNLSIFKIDCRITVENPKNSMVYSTRFTYDHTTKECGEIIYGGDEEKNIFWTKENCEKVCKGEGKIN